MNTKNIIVLIIIFLSVNIAVYKITEYNSKDRIDIVLKEDLNKLQIHYDILNTSQKNISYAISQSIIRNTDVIEFLKASYTTTKEQNQINREKLYNQLKEQYRTAKKQGVLQLQFVNKNNISFLRVHKPSKFGDDLTEIREDYKIVNETKKSIRGFTQGRVAHGFRNTFPLFDKNKNHIGAMEVSFSSEKYQWYLNNVSYIHSHFLVDKRIFDSKTWQRKSLVVNYEQSAESEKLMLSLNDNQSKDICIVNNRMKLEPYRKIIDEKIKEGKKFNFYTDYKSNIEIVSFLPIKNLSNETVAWIVSHTKSDIIKSSLKSTYTARIVVFFISILIIYLLARQIISNVKIASTLNKLNENKLFVDSILDNSGHAIITTDTDGLISLFNKKAEKLLGYKADEVVGKHSPALFHKKSEVLQRAKEFSTKLKGDIESGFEVFIAKNSSGIDNSDEWTYISKDKKEFTVILTITEQKDKNGTLIGYIGIAEDITEKKILQNALNEQKNELETIFNTTKDGIAIVDLETNFLFFNDTYLKMSGFTKEELLEKSCVCLSVPEDLSIFKEVLGEVLEKGFAENFENTCIVKDNKHLEVNMSIALMPDKQRLLISVKDITELKAKERKIKEYLNLVDKNIITSSTDLNGNITYTSEAFCKISKYTKDELLGKNHKIIRHPDMPDSIYKDLWHTITNNKTWQGEIKNSTKDGSYYWVNATISPIYNELGEKVGYTAIRQDITDKKNIELISITDGLTDIYNRRHFNEVFPKMIKNSKRGSELLCFLIMDIDHFKQYNDIYGHQMGDDVLIKIAASIKSSLNREEDICFRLGGEEFGILYKASNKNGALSFANEVRKNLENLKIDHSGNSASKYVTASMGLLCKQASDIEGDEVAYKQADDLLYKAKESGRNKVIMN